MKRLRGLLLSFFAFLLSVFVVTTPVFADPDTNSPDTGETTTIENPEEGEEGEEGEESEPEEVPTCAEQIDKLAWLVCPGTGLLANMIDGAYGLLTYLIKIDPLPADDDSPFHLIWTYCRDLTNIVFILVLLICIVSQITGWGISNHGIKRMLPRLVVLVILCNLSYFLCRIAVDLSNIVGNGLSGIFELVQDKAIASGAISLDLSEVGAGTLITTFLGIGGAAVAGANIGLAFVGGFKGLIWFLLPIILSGALAVLSALLTMAARQSLIYLLVMISPLAIVAYALPNTESWAQKWYSLLMRMLFFYPMFTLLYSASRLAGLVIMSTASGMTDGMEQAITIVLGLAVQLIPLFMSIPLMRMSGTFLGKISGIVNKIATPAARTFDGYAVERRKHAIESLRRGNNPMLYAHLARYMQQRKTDRVNEIKELEAINRDTYERRYMQGYYGRNGQLSNRGVMHYEIAASKVENARIASQIDTDFDEGFSTDEHNIDDRISRKHYSRIHNANSTLATELDRTEIGKARADRVRRDNIRNRAVHLQQAIDGTSDNPIADSYTRSLLNDTFRVQNAEQYDRARSAVLSRVISEQTKADAETRAENFALLDNLPAGNLVNEALERAFVDKDYNLMEAALQVITKRGDQDLILKTVEKMTRDLNVPDNASNSEKNAMMNFQKHYLDAALGMKGVNVFMAAHAKANMIRRAKHEAGKPVEAFISMADFLNGVVLPGDDKDEVQSLSAKQIIEDYNDGSYFMTQDRTVFKQLLDFKRQGIIKETTPELFREKDIRSGMASGKMDGELLGNLLDYFSEGYKNVFDINDNTNADPGHRAKLRRKSNGEIKASAEKIAWAEDERHIAKTLAFIYSQLNGMNPRQVAGQKSTTIKFLNHYLGKYGRADLGFDENGYSIELRQCLESQIEQLNRPGGNATTLRNSMNPDVMRILGVHDPTRSDDIDIDPDDGDE